MCFTLATVKEFDDLPVQKDEPVTRARQRHGGTSRTLAWLLDDLITIPGTNRRVGLDPLVGLVPGAGDILSHHGCNWFDAYRRPPVPGPITGSAQDDCQHGAGLTHRKHPPCR